MAKTIVYDYEALQSTSASIKAHAEEIKSAGTTLISALETATTNWEGASKDKFMQVINNTVKQYVETTFPQSVTEFANVMDKDAEAMKTADDDVANGINV